MEEEIEEQIRNLRKKKAAGRDDIPNKAWFYSEGSTRKKLKELIKKVWDGEGFPEDWRRAAYKIYATILNEKLRKDVEEKGILPDTQAGFRKHSGTIDNAYILQHVVERETLKKKGKVYALFVDLKATFDTVKRNEGMTEEFWTGEGLRQSCPLSPSLFTIFLADMEEYMRKDDEVLVTKREEELKGVIKRLENYLDKKELRLNVEKTEVMIFRKGGGKTKETQWKWKGREIEVNLNLASVTNTPPSTQLPNSPPISADPEMHVTASEPC
ncbi:uncharacterized protein LOC144470014 [Augochlora pura]